jgi:hypothetical protein
MIVMGELLGHPKDILLEALKYLLQQSIHLHNVGIAFVYGGEHPSWAERRSPCDASS